MLVAVTVLLGSGTALGGCDGGHDTLVIGVRPGRPGLAERLPSGGFAGFEIEVAHYVARRLGYRDDQISYVEMRTPAGAAPPVDLAMGTLLGRRAGTGPFSGPYLVSEQDILTGVHDISVQRLGDLAQKRVCTTSPGPLVARFGVAWRRAFLTTSTMAGCVRRLTTRRVNAVTGDAAVLAVVSAAAPGGLRLVGAPFAPDKYGIALREDSGDLHTEIDDALRTMFEDGTWRRAIIDHLGSLAAKYPSPPALERYVRTRSAP
ncbi:transporter substrate-binding domain-containing protein [Sphaerisporangium corydalis]|uniref:Transporter substrate-binding domain-containing protein n=1 Tax=Sphaerisporangium corydalis TaxID=1441875 RepID=A0ABV9E5I1_9ACTN|nr:transporter substrate-binding domain-containing protein [Sphaerisporangium corydalis]